MNVIKRNFYESDTLLLKKKNRKKRKVRKERKRKKYQKSGTHTPKHKNICTLICTSCVQRSFQHLCLWTYFKRYTQKKDNESFCHCVHIINTRCHYSMW